MKDSSAGATGTLIGILTAVAATSTLNANIQTVALVALIGGLVSFITVYTKERFLE